MAEKTVFKILIGRAEIGGTIDRQKQVQEKAASDLEAQLNKGDILEVLTVSGNQTDHEFQLIAVVKTEAAIAKAAVKGGK